MTRKNANLAAAAAAVSVIALLVVGWAVDAAAGSGEVRRNVHLAGKDIGGLDHAGLDAVMDEIGATLASTPVEVDLDGDTNGDGEALRSTLGDLAVGIDREATSHAALRAGRGGFFLFGPLRFLGSFFGHRDAAVTLAIDDATTGAALEQLGTSVRVEPQEPGLAYRDGSLQAVVGRPGSRLDTEDLLTQLRALDGGGLDGSPVVLHARMTSIPPAQADEVAEALLDRLEQRLEVRLELTVGDTRRTLDATELAPFIKARLAEGDKLTVELDQQRTLAFLAETFADIGTEAESPDISVSGGRVVIGYAKPGTVCCTPEAVTNLARAIERGDRSVTLPMAERKPEKDAAYYEKLGVKELVSTFTTQHPCCAPRVANIHRMADLVGPRLIAPGETFSLNDTVGRRTTAKGFVAAPTIDGAGNFVDDVGGGVSQFSTTLFNAAFFAGLEIDEYMAHGLYISRYPYGREATLSFPSPDLKIRNITEYGVLIWPTYTDTSITVSMYSTKNVEAAQTAQSESVYGKVCTEVTTTRTRTWLKSGKSETDKFYALYGPAEGVQCDGTVIPKDGVTTTTVVATTVVTPTTGGPPPTTAPPPPTTAAPTTTTGG